MMSVCLALFVPHFRFRLRARLLSVSLSLYLSPISHRLSLSLTLYLPLCLVAAHKKPRASTDRLIHVFTIR